MQEIIITKNEEGYKLRKLCMNYLSLAPQSFIYKMLRKKNIVLNDKKADGNEVLKIGDSVKFYMRDETIAGFQNISSNKAMDKININPLEIVYEDDDMILVNKPAGVLSQKASTKDVSINEMIIDYLIQTGSISSESMKTFKPSVCNRLDRNTSGIIMASKSPAGAHYLTEAIRNRTIKKYYITVVHGNASIDGVHKALLSKDSKTNKVTVTDLVRSDSNDSKQKGDIIITGIKKMKYNRELDLSLLEIELITGKSHQIRAHLNYLGYPIIGDTKYGNKEINSLLYKKYKQGHQLLTAYKVIFEDGKSYMINPPHIYEGLFGNGYLEN